MYLGIDFGTSTNYIVKWDEEIDVIREVSNIDKYGEQLLDNSIYYSKDMIIIGSKATQKIETDPKNLVRYIKLYMGNENFREYIPALKKSLTAREIATDIFKKLREKILEQDKSKAIEGVVLTVPFGYLHNSRQDIKNAAIDAGFKVLALIEEPLAAAIRVQDIRKDNFDIKRSVVFDIGGGTLDITVFESRFDKKTSILKVLNTHGHKNIGGKYIDDVIFEKIRSVEEIEFSLIDKLKIMNVIKEAKEAISDEETEIIYEYDEGCLDYCLSDEILFEILEDSKILDDIEYILDCAIEESGLLVEQIDELIMVGGSSKLKVLREFVEKKLNCTALDIGDSTKLVGEGAALYARSIIKKDALIKIVPTLNHNIGIDKNGIMISILEKNTEYEVESKIEIFNTPKSNDEIFYIDVYQGDDKRTVNCVKVGRISIKASDFTTSIGISFSVSGDGIIKYKLYRIDEMSNKILVLKNELR